VRSEQADEGAVTAEAACLTVTATAMAVALYEVLTSPHMRDLLYRPFVLALSWVL
jgi:hypothetical protein